MASLFMVANYSFVMTGFVIVGLGAYSTVFVSGFDTNLNILVGLFVCLGLYIALNAIIGIVGAFQKSLVLLKVCLAMSLCSFLLQVRTPRGQRALRCRRRVCCVPCALLLDVRT